MILNPMCAGSSDPSRHPEWKRETVKRLRSLILEHDVTAGALLRCEEGMGQPSLIMRGTGFCSGNSRIKVLAFGATILLNWFGNVHTVTQMTRHAIAPIFLPVFFVLSTQGWGRGNGEDMFHH